MSADRYESCRKLPYESPLGVRVTYLEPRTLRRPGAAKARTTVAAGEALRPDLVAQRTLGNPLLAWRLADANLTTSPLLLTATTGKVVDVPGPQL